VVTVRDLRMRYGENDVLTLRLRGGDQVSDSTSTSTSRKLHAMRLGLRRGLMEFVQSIRSTQDRWFYLFTAVCTLGYLWLRRGVDTGGPGLEFASIALSSILGALVACGVVIGPTYALAMEREDGTLLRHRAIPEGLVGYFSGQVLCQSLTLVRGCS
jgi:ABC-2 type transport system permease protein